MANRILRINWKSEREYVTLNLSRLPRKGESIVTMAYWPGEKLPVSYTATCVRSGARSGQYELELLYTESENPQLKGTDALWGKSTIRFGPDFLTATASWDDRDDSWSSGDVRAELLGAELVDDSQHRTQASKIARPMQQAIRQILLDIDGRCAVTGESTIAALDVAHLLDVQRKGAMSMHNCFLLRADVHRLFDRGLIAIGRSGALKLNEGVSKSYWRELSDCRLDKAVLARVRGALVLRAKSRGGVS